MAAAALGVALAAAAGHACSAGPRQAATPEQKRMAKYEWLASNSAPAGCLMEITSGSFSFPDGGSVYIPARSLSPGWGQRVSLHLVGEDTKPIPDRMEITFFSYLEDRFYRGTFALPRERIEELFAAGYKSYEEPSGHATFNAIVAGVAPGGVVAVWLSGIERQVEVFFGQAGEVALDWHATIGAPQSVDRKVFVEEALAEAAADDARAKSGAARVPLGTWATYRQRYRWVPVFEGMPAPERIERVSYYNGERDYLRLPLDAEGQRAERPVPSAMRFTSGGRAYVLTFDEEEMLGAFRRLGAGAAPLELVFSTKSQNGQAVFGVLLRNAEEVVGLARLRREFFDAR